MYFPVFQILSYFPVTSMPVFRLKGSMPMASRGFIGAAHGASKTCGNEKKNPLRKFVCSWKS